MHVFRGLGAESHPSALLLSHTRTHTEDVELQRPVVTLADGRRVPGGGEMRRVVTGAPPIPQLVPQFGYVSLFPLLMRLIPPNAPELGRQLHLLRDESRLWTPYGLRSLRWARPPCWGGCAAGPLVGGRPCTCTAPRSSTAVLQSFAWLRWPTSRHTRPSVVPQPSVCSRSASLYQARNTEHDAPYWRGAVWININYLAVQVCPASSSAPLGPFAAARHRAAVCWLSRLPSRCPWGCTTQPPANHDLYAPLPSTPGPAALWLNSSRPARHGRRGAAPGAAPQPDVQHCEAVPADRLPVGAVR